MKKNSCEKIVLKKGAMDVYDFGTVRLHAYRTNDAINDEVFFFEKEGKAVALESPCFFDNYKELTEYFAQRNIAVEAMLISYHMAGGTYLPGVRKYATRNAVEYGTSGGGKALADSFTQAFGAAFDGKAHEVTDVIPEGEITLCGIDFLISPTQDAFDVEIPEIHAVYTHMLGHDCHSIVAGAAHADAVTAQLEGFRKKGYTLILTSHYTPEDLKDAETKIAYLKDLKAAAFQCTDKSSFLTEMKRRFPGYAGENYLEMTAGFFFGS